LENRFLKETWLELTKDVGRFKEYLSEIKKEIDDLSIFLNHSLN
jgi:hypothetical protein